MAKIFTFTAAIKRDGQEVRNVTSCATHEGYLCLCRGSKLQPLWDSVAIQREGVGREITDKLTTVQAAIEAGYAHCLIRFGKQEGYWVWNVEAAERKKLEAGKTVYLYEKKGGDWDDDEPEIRLTDRNYPKEVWAAITPNVLKDRRGYEVRNYPALATALTEIGWKLNI